ncbi:Uncharacterized protein Adt_30601 [Abeliophyllum distichum]|uniref:Uncharacterized protein n=1 Tax=Abeliophyllum distichum TaxID=126358 RepID=A0ABD1RBR0_9LAMI
MTRFEDLYRCDIHEDSYVTVTRLINGSRLEIKYKVSLQSLESAKDAYHKALEVEKYLRSYTLKCVPRSFTNPRQSHPNPFNRTPGGSQYPQPRTPNGPPSKAPITTPIAYSQSVASSSATPHVPAPNIVYHNCHT